MSNEKTTLSARPGFKGFRKPEAISNKDLERALTSIETDGLYVYFTGGKNRARKASLRSRALATITEVKKPVPLATLLERAARAISAQKGFDPYVVKGGLALAQGAKPAVYFYLEKDDAGNFRAVKDIPTPDGMASSFKAGAIVIPAKGKKSA